MAQEQLTFKDDRITQILNAAFLDFRQGKLEKALGHLEGALKMDFEHPGVVGAMKCAGFWKERQQRVETMKELYDRGKYLLDQWRIFVDFCGRIGGVSERCIFVLKQYVFSVALSSFLQLYDEGDVTDWRLLLQIGRCHKAKGNYEAAIEFLEMTTAQRKDSPEAIAELADCYSLVDEARAAKVFFREAFFLDPERIELKSIESPMIRKLATKLREAGYREPELLHWLPVYATVYGVFSIRRELRPVELGRLKQSIYALEKRAATEGRSPILVADLINRYFWLVDHYSASGETRPKIDEVLSKVKDLDDFVFREYTN